MRRRPLADSLPAHIASFEAYRRRTGGNLAAWRQARLAFAAEYPDLLDCMDAVTGVLHVRRELEGSLIAVSPLSDGTRLHRDGTRTRYVPPRVDLDDTPTLPHDPFDPSEI